MSLPRRILVIFFALALLAACKHKKKAITLTGEDPVEVADFIGFFQTVDPPFTVTDSIFKKKDKDSLQVSNKVFSQFVPDSVLSKVYGKGVKPKIYAIGKVKVPKGESYLFVKTFTAEKKAVYILSFDNSNKFISSLVALRPDQSSTTTQSLTLDKRLSITKSIILRNADGTISEGKDVYILNADSRNFMLIMTDALGDRVTELINPIDTLPRKNKFSADYGPGKMNLVSIRDGRKPDRLSFFVHFEKDNGQCTGELKGEAFFKSNNLAEYRESGDPCILQFSFTSSSVTLTETNCGSRRGLKCSFDGSFGRRKWIKPAPPKTDKTIPNKNKGNK